MSIFDDIDTLCDDADNRCKRRKKCKRYLEYDPTTQGRWVASYFVEFGQKCPHFIPAKKPIEVPTRGGNDAV